MISLTAKVPAVPVTQLVPWTPVRDIANAKLMLKVLLVASANHYIGIWPKKTPMDVQVRFLHIIIYYIANSF